MRGAWWRTFGLILLANLVALLPGVLILAPFGELAKSTDRAVWSLVGTMAAETITAPFVALFSTLLYFDLRAGRRAGAQLAAVALASPARAGPGSAVRAGGEGSAVTDTVSATLRVIDRRLPPASIATSSPESDSVALEARAKAAVHQVVQQVLGLVLEAQDAHLGALLDVGERHAVSRAPSKIGWPCGQVLASPIA